MGGKNAFIVKVTVDKLCFHSCTNKFMYSHKSAKFSHSLVILASEENYL